MSTNTFSSNFSSDAVTYIAAKTLDLAKKQMVAYQLCDKAPLPKGNSRTFQFTRYERLNLPQTKLTEGVTPGDSSMSISTVSAVMDQWGAVVPISDVAIDTVKHPVLQHAIELLAMQAAETIDREILKVALAGTQIYYPAAVSSRATITSSDKLASAVVGKTVANLRNKGALPYDGQNYVGMCDPFAEDDMVNDSTFVTASAYGQIKNLLNQEIGTWKGIRWVRSNTLPMPKKFTGGSGASSNTAGSLSASTTYNAKLVVVDAKTGFETFIHDTFNAATDASKSSVDITVPALPSGATAGSKFRLYFGSNGGTLYKAADDVSASSTYNQGTLPTSGDVAPASCFSTTLAVHQSLVLGKQGICAVELSKLQSTLTPAQASDSDPLIQRRKAGWKCDFKAVITNDDFVARIEHAATNF